MKTVIIMRKYWGQYLMRNDEGKKCCLGFVSEAYGVPPEKTLNKEFPCQLRHNVPKDFPDWLLTNHHHHDVAIASGINDDMVLSLKEKEAQLKELFAKHNIRLIFRGKP